MGDLGDEPEITVVEINPPSEQEEGTPLRPIFCLKKKVNMKELEEREDCFILDFDPDDSLDLSNLSVSKDPDVDSPDISVIAEKGQVRFYPIVQILPLIFSLVHRYIYNNKGFWFFNLKMYRDK